MSMKLLTISSVVALLVAAPLIAQQKTKPPTRAEVLKAIEVFVQTPTTPAGQSAAETISRFADESDDVTVVLGPAYVPWVEVDKPHKHAETLLAAYAAGNIKSQLDRKTDVNDSYAGLVQVLKTYKQLQAADKTLKIVEVEFFVDLDAKKQLKKYVDDSIKLAEKDEKIKK